MRAESLARAMELDDSFPNNVCPGCQQDITGWEVYLAHWRPDAQLKQPIKKRNKCPRPFTHSDVNGNTDDDPCVWTRDYLTARAFRRAYIAQHSRVAS